MEASCLASTYLLAYNIAGNFYTWRMQHVPIGNGRQTGRAYAGSMRHPHLLDDCLRYILPGILFNCGDALLFLQSLLTAYSADRKISLVSWMDIHDEREEMFCICRETSLLCVASSQRCHVLAPAVTGDETHPRTYGN